MIITKLINIPSILYANKRPSFAKCFLHQLNARCWLNDKMLGLIIAFFKDKVEVDGNDKLISLNCNIYIYIWEKLVLTTVQKLFLYSF